MVDHSDEQRLLLSIVCSGFFMPTTQYWRLPSRTIRLALRSDALLFYQRDVQPLLCISDPAVPGMVKQQCNMQQVIEFESSAKQQPIDVRATIQRKIKSLNLWLDSKSEFYSRICEFSVTRRLVIRVNLVSLCVIVAAVAIEQQPITSVVSTLCAGYLVYRMNKSEKKGGKK